MSTHQKLTLTLAVLATVTAIVLADDAPTKPTTDQKPAASTPSTDKATGKFETSTNSVAKFAGKQADVASKTAKFGKVAKTDDLYKTALDAHNLDQASKQTNKEGAFKGKVIKIFEPRAGGIAIVNFDTDYKSALTALLKKEDYEKFPVLTSLTDKEVVVTGKFVEFSGRSEIILTNTTQIKVVE